MTAERFQSWQVKQVAERGLALLRETVINTAASAPHRPACQRSDAKITHRSCELTAFDGISDGAGAVIEVLHIATCSATFHVTNHHLKGTWQLWWKLSLQMSVCVCLALHHHVLHVSTQWLYWTICQNVQRPLICYAAESRIYIYKYQAMLMPLRTMSCVDCVSQRGDIFFACCLWIL